MKDIIKKIESDTLNETDKLILIEILKEQKKTIEYYSQNFAGTWNCDDVNVNWRAKKCTEHIENKKKEIEEEDTVVIDAETSNVG